tara:strand:+ start:3723 stop:5048 length:1326 start_codon:yes stop_codon:yes gene_type:complete
MKMINIFLYEFKHFVKIKAKLVAYLFFVLACIYSIYNGFILQNDHLSTIENIQEQEDESISQVLNWHENGEKGPKDKDWIDVTDPYWSLRYTPIYVVKNPSLLLPLGLGQSEQYGYYKKVTIWSSTFDSDIVEEISNYERLINGKIDFSFLILFILPLLLIILTYNLNGLEKDLKFDDLIAIQTGNSKNWILHRLIFYAALLLSTVNVLIVSVVFINNILIGDALDLILLSNLYVFIFLLPFYFIIVSSSSSTSIAFKMISMWLLLCVLIPGSVHQYVSLKYPPNYMTDFLDANRKDTYAVFKLPKDELHHLIMGVYLDLDTTKQGQDSLINRTIVRNTMSALVNQINIYAINKIEQQNDSKNNLITSSYWFNPVSYFQNEWNTLTSTDYHSYKDYRSDIQYAINNRLELLTFECWNERKVNANIYDEYLKKLKSKRSDIQ